MKSLIYPLLTIILFGCQPTTEKWTVLYKSGTNGQTISGSKKALINAIRNGADIKVGWGFKGKAHSIEHLSNPIWIGILDEKEVMVHLDPQVLSAMNWEALRPNYADSSLLLKEWRVVISTKGDFDAVWYDRRENKVVERRPQKHPISWFARNNALKESSTPLFEE